MINPNVRFTVIKLKLLKYKYGADQRDKQTKLLSSDFKMFLKTENSYKTILDNVGYSLDSTSASK